MQRLAGSPTGKKEVGRKSITLDHKQLCQEPTCRAELGVVLLVDNSATHLECRAEEEVETQEHVAGCQACWGVNMTALSLSARTKQRHTWQDLVPIVSHRSHELTKITLRQQPH